MAKQKLTEYVQVNGKWSFFRTREFLILVIVILIAAFITLITMSFKYKDGKFEFDPVIKKIEIQKDL